MKTILKLTFILSPLFFIAACGGNKKATVDSDSVVVMHPVGPSFNEDSAYAFCKAQCDFGPRTINSRAHEKCGKWIMDKFEQYGLTVTPQRMTLNSFDGQRLRCTNIIASYRPELTSRILLCAHWDTRPWADNDPDSLNRRKPIIGANDGASGVAVLLEIARLLATDSAKVNLGIDFICFDAEDRGVPRWSNTQDDGSSWAMGSQYWSLNPHKPGYEARFGILLDMVGGQGAQFWQESISKQYAQGILDKVWASAETVGFGSYFNSQEGGMINDDHVAINQNAKIPTIDIVPFYPDCKQSNFGPTWHTLQDNMNNIDKNTLKAVGQTVVQVIYAEK